jgi:hypothetical protein
MGGGIRPFSLSRINPEEILEQYAFAWRYRTVKRRFYRRIEVISCVRNSGESVDGLKPGQPAYLRVNKLPLVEGKCAVSHAGAELNPASCASSSEHPDHVQY